MGIASPNAMVVKTQKSKSASIGCNKKQLFEICGRLMMVYDGL
jgi:hypothetical protein